MPSFLASISDLITGFFGAIFAILQSAFNFVFGIIQAIFATIGTFISRIAHTFEGLFKVLLSNIVVIGAVVGAFFLYTIYQQRNGRSVTQAPAGSKKIN